MVLGIKFQTYTTLVSFLIPNPYHYMNQTPLKWFDTSIDVTRYKKNPSYVF